MNWYKISQQVPWIQISHYNQTDNELTVRFGGGDKMYTYEGVNPDGYRKIGIFLKYKNYKAAKKLLDQWAALSKQPKAQQ
jgi:hypothetical protein